MALTSGFIVVGRLLSVYGLKGWVKIRSYTEIPERLFNYQPWLLSMVSGVETALIEQWRRHNKGFVAKIANINDRQQARALCGTDIAIAKTQLPALEAGEYYWRQLQGLQVISQFKEGKSCLGTIKGLIPTGANDVLIVQGDGCSIDRRERLIPYVVGQYVTMVDLDGGIVYVDWDPAF